MPTSWGSTPPQPSIPIILFPAFPIVGMAAFGARYSVDRFILLFQFAPFITSKDINFKSMAAVKASVLFSIRHNRPPIAQAVFSTKSPQLAWT